ncbi:hypothetical protein EIN_047700 [Entamoeba invadens IP1]|uniref:Uncharacterized protein n=1 Tax=Entamoeba invadens IP1 TaxID=370355 RepID=A0A0A1UG67_ENTIV|nr:hypothetical protein EIN_047700 [Entamoeba invadens IP1]ELP94467.1 hypothetical protein EIN_047700 [Entamoeba invadens IP1]|eukprot:XP_004261238.1 hypothetical protein EIN_047700 [Entamoeba invadens IP1]
MEQQQKKRVVLERVYLLNVVLFFENTEVLLNFIQVSKKCVQTCQDLYTNPPKIVNTLSDLFLIFSLFKKINTLSFPTVIFSKASLEGSEYSDEQKAALYDKLKTLDFRVAINYWSQYTAKYFEGLVDNFKSISISRLTSLDYSVKSELSPFYLKMDFLQRVALTLGNSNEYLLKKKNPLLKVLVLNIEDDVDGTCERLVDIQMVPTTKILFFFRDVDEKTVEKIESMRMKYFPVNECFIYCKYTTLPIHDIISKRVILLPKDQRTYLSPDQLQNNDIEQVIQLYGILSIQSISDCMNKGILTKSLKTQLRNVVVLNLMFYSLRMKLVDVIPDSLVSLSLENVVMSNDIDLSETRLVEINFTRCDFIHLNVPKTVKRLRVSNNNTLNTIEGTKNLNLELIVIFSCKALDTLLFESAKEIKLLSSGIKTVNTKALENADEVSVQQCKFVYNAPNQAKQFKDESSDFKRKLHSFFGFSF